MFSTSRPFQFGLLCCSLLFAAQSHAAGGIFYSEDGSTITIPNGAEAIIILKKGSEITALDSRGNPIAPCDACDEDLDNTKLLLTLNKNGKLNLIGPSAEKLGNKAGTAQDDFAKTVSEGVKLRKIAKQAKAHHGLLFTQEGDLVVMDIDKGEVLKPIDKSKSPVQIAEEHAQEIAGMKHPKVSDAEFVELQNKFESTITTKVTKGSVCMTIVKEPPGRQWTICSPPYPQWW